MNFEEEDIKEEGEESEDAKLQKKIDLFNALDSELLHLKKVHIIALPIIELIDQRESIIKEYNEAMNPEKKEVEKQENKTEKSSKQKSSQESKKQGTKGGKTSKGSKEEKTQSIQEQRKLKRVEGIETAKKSLLLNKINRRHKCVLPRIERKLKLQLIEFKEQDGEDFIWGGKPYIDELQDITLTQIEIENAKKSSRKKSNATAASARRKSNLSFFPYEENVSRRHSVVPKKKAVSSKKDGHSKERRSIQ